MLLLTGNSYPTIKLYTELAPVERIVIVVFVHAVVGDRYNTDPSFVSCPTIVFGIRPSECLIVKSVFAAPGEVPCAFQIERFVDTSALDMVEP
jgi:hypothetical protein